MLNTGTQRLSWPRAYMDTNTIPSELLVTHLYYILPPPPRPNSHILTLIKQDPDKGLHLRETRMPKAQHQDIARPFGFIPWLLVLESIGACKRAQAGGRSRTITCAQSEGARE